MRERSAGGRGRSPGLDSLGLLLSARTAPHQAVWFPRSRVKPSRWPTGHHCPPAREAQSPNSLLKAPSQRGQSPEAVDPQSCPPHSAGSRPTVHRRACQPATRGGFIMSGRWRLWVTPLLGGGCAPATPHVSWDVSSPAGPGQPCAASRRRPWASRRRLNEPGLVC